MGMFGSDPTKAAMERMMGVGKPKRRYGKYGIFHVVQGRYPGGRGWEDVTVEESYSEGKKRLREYNENEPYPHRMIRRRMER